MIRIGIFGLLGYERAEELLRSHKEELEKRFSGRFLEGFRKLAETRREPVLPSVHRPKEGSASVHTEPEDLCPPPLFRLFPIEEGGLFAGLWKLCEEVTDPVFRPDPGCLVDVLQVPVPQAFPSPSGPPGFPDLPASARLSEVRHSPLPNSPIGKNAER